MPGTGVSPSPDAPFAPFCEKCGRFSMVAGFCSNKVCLEFRIPASCPFKVQRTPRNVVIPSEVNHLSKSIVTYAGYSLRDRGVIRRVVLRGLCMDSFSAQSRRNVLYVDRLGAPRSGSRWARIVQLLEGLNHFHHKSQRVAEDIAWLRENRWRLVGGAE